MAWIQFINTSLAITDLVLAKTKTENEKLGGKLTGQNCLTLVIPKTCFHSWCVWIWLLDYIMQQEIYTWGIQFLHFLHIIKYNNKINSTLLYHLSLWLVPNKAVLLISWKKITKLNQTACGFVQWGILIDSHVINQFPINLLCQQHAVRTPLPTIHHTIP